MVHTSLYLVRYLRDEKIKLRSKWPGQTSVARFIRAACSYDNIDGGSLDMLLQDHERSL